MKFSKSTAQKLAAQIRQRFGQKIARAVEGTPVPQKFVAGLISVEAGKKNGQIVENATRFEPHVFAKLKQVRDGKLLQYNKIRRAQIADASDEALEALARSYGLTQTMGWWSLHLKCTVADLRDPEKHLKYAVKLMLLNSQGDFERGEFEGEMRQWNSGSEKGKTHDPDYVANVSAVMDAYEELGDVDSVPVEDLAAPKDDKPEPVADEAKVVVQAEVPKETNPKEKAEVSGPKSWIAAVTTFLTTAGAGAISWVNGASKEIVVSFFAAAAIVGVVYVVARYWYRNKENQRLAEVQLAREKMAQEITLMKMKSAMQQESNTVEVAH